MDKIVFPLVAIIYFILIIILIINSYKKNNFIKYAFSLFFILAFVLIMMYDVTLIDQLLYYLIKYFYYPSYYVYMFTILFMVGILVYTIFNNKINNKLRVINYGFCGLTFVSYIVFLMLKVDVTNNLDLYFGSSLICLRIVSRGFMLWVILASLVKYYNTFVKRDVDND